MHKTYTNIYKTYKNIYKTYKHLYKTYKNIYKTYKKHIQYISITVFLIFSHLAEEFLDGCLQIRIVRKKLVWGPARNILQNGVKGMCVHIYIYIYIYMYIYTYIHKVYKMYRCVLSLNKWVAYGLLTVINVSR